MKSGGVFGPDDIPVEVWKCLGEVAVDFLIRLFNRILEIHKMPDKWRKSVLVPIYKKGDELYYRGVKLMSHTSLPHFLRQACMACMAIYGYVWVFLNSMVSC